MTSRPLSTVHAFWRRRVVAEDGDRGSAAVELAIMTPVVIVLLLAMVALGRYAHSGIVVEQAAAAAARSASLSTTPGDADRAARIAADSTLSGAGLSCATMTAAVDTTRFRPGGQVTVTVSCTADLSQLALAGVPGSTTATSTATAPLETFRPIRIGGH